MVALTQQEKEDLIQSGYRYACSISGDPDTSRDLVHDAWVSLSNRYSARPNKALLFRIIRNRYIDHYRRNTRFTHIDYDDQDVSIHDAADGEFGLAEPVNKNLAESLTTLRVEEREALFLSVVEGYTAAEIAKLSNRSRGTVLSLLHRAKAKLRKLLIEKESEAVSSSESSNKVVPIKRGKQ